MASKDLYGEKKKTGYEKEKNLCSIYSTAAPRKQSTQQSSGRNAGQSTPKSSGWNAGPSTPKSSGLSGGQSTPKNSGWNAGQSTPKNSGLSGGQSTPKNSIWNAGQSVTHAQSETVQKSKRKKTPSELGDEVVARVPVEEGLMDPTER